MQSIFFIFIIIIIMAIYYQIFIFFKNLRFLNYVQSICTFNLNESVILYLGKVFSNWNQFKD